MPLYEYLCQACGRRTEEMQRHDEPPLETCPHCGGKLRKLLSAPAFQFKGSGWYLTDYARKGSGKAGDASDGKASAGSDAKSGGGDGGDAKPAAGDRPAGDAATKSKSSSGGD